MEFKQYPSYKPSGVEWLGDVPDEWDIYPFWHLFNRKEITNKTQEQLLSVYLDRGVILHSEGGGMVHKPADNLEKYQLVEVNDFVMNNQQAWRGSVGVSPYKGIVSPAYLIFSFNKKICAPKFFKYFLRDKGVVDQFMIASMSVGTIQRQVKWHLLKTIQLSIPSLIEQNTIANFLDTETARIDNLISKQEKLIELLEEQRKSIISHAVTKGLNPNAPMKDSGVEWLGEVPKHWSYSSLKYVLKQKKGAIKSGPFGSHLKSSDMVYSDVKVINQRNVIDKDFIGGDNFISFEKYEELKSFTIYPKDVLVTTRGTIGKVAQVAEDLPISILHPCLIRIQVDENKVLFDYINYFFECEKLSLEQLRYASNAATIDVIYCENLASIYLPIPSISEQNEIIKYLKDEDIKINKLISKQKTLIEKLKEYRSSIISHAVTGKIDVREFVA